MILFSKRLLFHKTWSNFVYLVHSNRFCFFSNYSRNKSVKYSEKTRYISLLDCDGCGIHIVQIKKDTLYICFVDCQLFIVINN